MDMDYWNVDTDADDKDMGNKVAENKDRDMNRDIADNLDESYLNCSIVTGYYGGAASTII